MLCTQVLNGLDGSLTALSFSAGTEFDVLVVSFDPGETPALAAESRKKFLNRYRRTGAEGGVHFLTGRQESISKHWPMPWASGTRTTRRSISTRIRRRSRCSPGDGRVSRYLYGIEFAPKDLRLGLIEAADGTHRHRRRSRCCSSATTTTRRRGKYGLAIMNLIRLAGVLTVVGLGAFIVWLAAT